MSLSLAPVSSAALWEATVGPFDGRWGVDLSALGGSIVRRARTEQIAAADLLADPAPVATVAWPRTEGVTGRATLATTRAGRCHGFAGWFTLHLAPGVDLDAGPAAAPTHWRHTYFPVAPFELSAGAPLELEVDVAYAAEDRRGLEVRTRWSGPVEGAAFHRVR